ncbi:MAG: hypothetical protein JETCAE03_35940 [Ignavibacteriaceae bacterium]|jgi:hypothetical protein|nr:MAG: hypothetical protein JETCAE03_35940 [Ignavibacteriaceae bacterium]
MTILDRETFAQRLEVRDLLSHAILSAITTAGENDKKIIDEYHKGGNLKVDFKINGVDVSFVPFFEKLDKELDRLIEEQAAKKIIDAHYDEIDLLKETIIDTTKILKKKIATLFPEFNSDEDD